MGALNTALSELRAAKTEQRDPAITAVMDRATRELRDSGIMERVTRVGDPAPYFARPGVDGVTVRLTSLLQRGPLVLSFFRGRW